MKEDIHLQRGSYELGTYSTTCYPASPVYTYSAATSPVYTYVYGYSAMPNRIHPRQYKLLCSVAKRAPYVCMLLVPCLLSVSLLGVSKGVGLHGVG